MPRATFNSKNSMSSIVASILIEDTGIKDIIKETIKPEIRSNLAKSYTSKIRTIASSPELWGDTSNTLNVSIPSDSSVSITIEGSDNDVYKAHELEFGTPSEPPRSVVRTFQEILNQDLMNDIGRMEI